MIKTKYIKPFISETEEILEKINDIVYKNDFNDMESLYRYVHTLKGNAGGLGFTKFSLLFHNLEELLGKNQKGTILSDRDKDIICAYIELASEIFSGIKQNNSDITEGIEAKIIALNNSAAPEIPKKKHTDFMPFITSNEAENLIGKYHLIKINFESDSGFVFLRAVMILEKILSSAKIIKIFPARDEIEKEKIENAMIVILESESYSQKIYDKIRNTADVVSADEDELDTKEKIEKYFRIERRNPGETRPDTESDSSYYKINASVIDSISDTINELALNTRIIETKLEEYNLPELSEMISYNKIRMNELLNSANELKLIPIMELFDKLFPVVRNVSKKLNKKITFNVEGTATKIERKIISSLRDPLIHIIRNSIDHGIENAEERISKGKNANGRITVKAYRFANMINIEISDDGRGFDIGKVKQKIIENGIETEETLKDKSDNEIIEYVFDSGFSTADTVSEISGRGIGLDVVKNEINKLNGRITINSRKDEGTVFVMSIPFSFGLLPVIICRIGNDDYCVPVDIIDDTIILNRNEIIETDKKSVYYNGKMCDYIELNSLMKNNFFKKVNYSSGNTGYAVIVKIHGNPVCLGIDKIIEQESVIIRQTESFVELPKYVIGTTILNSGLPSLIIDLNELIKKSYKINGVVK